MNSLRVLPLAFCFLLGATSANCQYQTGPTAMKQFAPGVGWVLNGKRLLWTQDNGSNWEDITPPGTPTAAISNLFFLNRTLGWAMLADWGENGAAELPIYQLASTSDAGKTWKIYPLDLSYEFRDGMGGPSMSFIDSQRGWLLLGRVSSSNFSFGLLLATGDGGATWKRLPAPPGAGRINFLTAKHAWLAGGVFGSLWVTHDGAKTWVQRNAPPPKGFEEGRVAHDMPVFQNPHDGVVTALIDTLEGQKALTYMTDSGGKTWQLREAFDGWSPVSIVGGHVIRAASFLGRKPQESGGSAQLPSGLSGRGEILAIDFVDDVNGWALYVTRGCAPGAPRPCTHPNDHATEIELLSTSNGASTFRKITPGQSAIPRCQ